LFDTQRFEFFQQEQNKQILRSPYCETRLEGERDDTEGTGSSVVRVRVEGDDIEGVGTSVVIVIRGTGTSVVRVRVEGDGIEEVDDDDFMINELEIRTQRVSKFLFQGF
jgi:hypothetical protein